MGVLAEKFGKKNKNMTSRSRPKNLPADESFGSAGDGVKGGCRGPGYSTLHNDRKMPLSGKITAVPRIRSYLVCPSQYKID